MYVYTYFHLLGAPRKVYLCTVFATAAVSYGFNELVKYKWYHEPKQN